MVYRVAETDSRTCDSEALAPTEYANERSEAAGRLPCPEDVTPGAYVATAFPTVGRASVTLLGITDPSKSWVTIGDRDFLVTQWGEVVLERPTVPDLERAERNIERSIRRSKKAVEDYVVHNCLTKMWTLTYRKKNFDRAAVVLDVQDFMLRWRKSVGQDFPYVYVLERHKDSSWHVHLAVRDGLWTFKGNMDKLWGHGLTQYSSSKHRRPGENRNDLRRLAVYLTKYIVKELGDEVGFGKHRYEVAEGFSPKCETRRFSNRVDAVAWLDEVLGPRNVQVWCSIGSTDWTGPTVWVYESP